jgi:hypothetical protein
MCLIIELAGPQAASEWETHVPFRRLREGDPKPIRLMTELPVVMAVPGSRTRLLTWRLAHGGLGHPVQESEESRWRKKGVCSRAARARENRAQFSLISIFFGCFSTTGMVIVRTPLSSLA